MVEQHTIQYENSGSIPTSPLQYHMITCKFKDIAHIFEKYHYKGRHMGGGISYCFALVYNNIEAGAVCGKLRQDQRYSSDNNIAIEIRRMACLDSCPKYTESYFLSKIIWWLTKNTDITEVISYSDKSVGHKGTIYKAANFKLIGETSPSKHVFWKGIRYHPRSLTIDRPYSYKLREAIKTGEATIETGEPKLIFSYKIKRSKNIKLF